MQHEIKVPPPTYIRVSSGEQTFLGVAQSLEVQRGDTLKLREWSQEAVSATDKTIPKGFTDSPPLDFTVGFVSRGVEDIVSLLPIKAAKAKKP